MPASHPPPIAFESERLALQLLDPETHLAQYHELWSTEAAMEWSLKELSTSHAQTLTYMQPTLRTPERPYLQHYAILLRSSLPPPSPSSPSTTASSSSPSPPPRLIGVVGIVRLEPRPFAADATTTDFEIAYKIHPDHWGLGYATEALRAFLQLYWALEERRAEGVDELVAWVDRENGASGRIMGKVGAVRRERAVRGEWEVRGKTGERWYDIWSLRRPGVEKDWPR